MTDKVERKLYGRKQTRALGQDRRVALETLLPRLAIATGDAPVNPHDLFTFAPTEVWLEIGFGNGEHVAALMQRHPERAYLACEPFITGMAAFLTMIEDKPQHNVRVWMDDALLLTARLTDASLDGIYILNPDPWPKSRHEKRRILSRANLDVFARLLRPGGTLIATTDHAALADWMITQGADHPAFEWTAERADDWRQPPPDWIETRYEAKGREAGRRQVYLVFRRR